MIIFGGSARKWFCLKSFTDIGLRCFSAMVIGAQWGAEWLIETSLGAEIDPNVAD
jgi:hypothetical protein